MEEKRGRGSYGTVLSDDGYFCDTPITENTNLSRNIPCKHRLSSSLYPHRLYKIQDIINKNRHHKNITTKTDLKDWVYNVVGGY